MSQNSTIEWTDATWNPVRGCTKISPGCKRCYAQVFAERWRGIADHPYEQGFDLRLVPERLLDPIKWIKSRHIFVNSMSDLFHETVPDSYIENVFEVMAKADWHIYQVLTKRADRLNSLLNGRLKKYCKLQHIWLGVSVEDIKYGVPRIEQLRNTPATVRFLSVEPLIEDVGKIDLRGINWVIVGGESGVGARKIEEQWVLNIRDQCLDASVPFFFKQWGGVRKKENGRILNGTTYDEMPKVRTCSAPDKIARAQLNESLQYLVPTTKTKIVGDQIALYC
jgi:protein gp37